MSEFEQAQYTNEAFKPVAGKTVVMFRAVQKRDNFKSEKEGRPVFKEVIHIVKIPADAKLRIDRPVRESDKEEYPNEWLQWERTRQSRVLGTPIEHWPAISDTQKEEFKAAKVYTVEQFAALPDSYAGVIGMGFHALREKAKVFVSQGKDAELIGQIRAEADARVSAMEAKMAEMQAMLEELTKPKDDKKSKAS